MSESMTPTGASGDFRDLLNWHMHAGTGKELLFRGRPGVPWSSGELGAACDVAPSTITRWRSGYQRPSPYSYERIERAFFGRGSEAFPDRIAFREAYHGSVGSLEGNANDPFTDLSFPNLPAQGPGPHFELTQKGVIDFVPPASLDREGNNVARLRQLHPILRDLARELADALNKGNVPHAQLAIRADAYRQQVEQLLDAIDFTLLFVEGVRLANAEKAAADKVLEGELPPLAVAHREALDTLLTLHGTFILSTTAGAELIASEQR